MPDSSLWDQYPQEFIDELMHRQHPEHNLNKPRPECKECQEFVEVHRQAMELRKLQQRPKPIQYDSPKPHEPFIRKVAKHVKYWDENEM